MNKYLGRLGVLVGIALCATAQAADTYLLANNQLTIPMVKVGDAYAYNVVIDIGKNIKLISMKAAGDTLTPDSFNVTNNQITIPHLRFNGEEFYGMVVEAWARLESD